MSELVGWIEEVVAQGIRRPGYPADKWTEEFIFQKFASLGLESVRLEPVESAYWKDSHAELLVGAGADSATIECFPVPLSAPIRLEE